jgi:predicted nucleotidyltransferase
MKKENVLEILGSRKEDLRQYHVSSIYLFGSVARGEEATSSDIDLLVDFADPVGIFDFVRLKEFLEAILGNAVDLVTRDALKDNLRDRILKETIRAA